MSLTCLVSKVAWAIVTVILRINDFSLASPGMFYTMAFVVYDRLSSEMTIGSAILRGLRYELAVRQKQVQSSENAGILALILSGISPWLSFNKIHRLTRCVPSRGHAQSLDNLLSLNLGNICNYLL